MTADSTSYTKKDVINIVLFDALLITGVYFIPSITHNLRIPLYMFEPMRFMLFASLLLMPKYRWNHFFLSATLPLVSFMVSGHPLLLKAFAMSFELVINVALLQLLIKTKWVFLSVLLSVILSKSAYYLIKIGMIYFGFLNMECISTGLLIQFEAAIVLSFLFSVFYKKNNG